LPLATTEEDDKIKTNPDALREQNDGILSKIHSETRLPFMVGNLREDHRALLGDLVSI
jgi:hypothetical protein